MRRVSASGLGSSKRYSRSAEKVELYRPAYWTVWKRHLTTSNGCPATSPAAPAKTPAENSVDAETLFTAIAYQLVRVAGKPTNEKR